MTAQHPEEEFENDPGGNDVVGLKPEIQASEPLDAVCGQLHGMTGILSRAADTIATMAQRNAALEARMDEMAAEFQSRVLDLQDRLRACEAELEAKTHEAELAKQWLMYISNGITVRLGDAPKRLQELALQTRAGLDVLHLELAAGPSQIGSVVGGATTVLSPQHGPEHQSIHSNERLASQEAADEIDGRH